MVDSTKFNEMQEDGEKEEELTKSAIKEVVGVLVKGSVGVDVSKVDNTLVTSLKKEFDQLKVIALTEDSVNYLENCGNKKEGLYEG